MRRHWRPETRCSLLKWQLFWVRTGCDIKSHIGYYSKADFCPNLLYRTKSLSARHLYLTVPLKHLHERVKAKLSFWRCNSSLKNLPFCADTRLHPVGYSYMLLLWQMLTLKYTVSPTQIWKSHWENISTLKVTACAFLFNLTKCWCFH